MLQIMIHIISNINYHNLILGQGILIVQWLERCAPNFPVVGSNLAHACKTGIPRPDQCQG